MSIGIDAAVMMTFPVPFSDGLNDEILAIAQESYAAIPAEMRRYADDIVITLQDFPDRETLDRMGCRSEWDLLGLYQGIAIGEKSAGHVAPEPDRIFLYTQPIAGYADYTGESLEQVVRHVLIHEIGHHFGLSDDDMHRIEAAAEAASGDK